MLKISSQGWQSSKTLLCYPGCCGEAISKAFQPQDIQTQASPGKPRAAAGQHQDMAKPRFAGAAI